MNPTVLSRTQDWLLPSAPPRMPLLVSVRHRLRDPTHQQQRQSRGHQPGKPAAPVSEAARVGRAVAMELPAAWPRVSNKGPWGLCSHQWQACDPVVMCANPQLHPFQRSAQLQTPSVHSFSGTHLNSAESNSSLKCVEQYYLVE